VVLLNFPTAAVRGWQRCCWQPAEGAVLHPSQDLVHQLVIAIIRQMDRILREHGHKLGRRLFVIFFSLKSKGREDLKGLYLLTEDEVLYAVLHLAHTVTYSSKESLLILPVRYVIFIVTTLLCRIP
jgi:hypothetical protein